jgi:F-type H+-transporting ATPase subunit b
MMGSFLFLAEAHSEVEGGFGLNLDILNTNLINLALLLGILVYYGKPIVGNILKERRAKIAEQIEEVEAKQKQAAATLAEEQAKLKQAEATAAKVRSEAEAQAQKAKDSILAQGAKEVERLKAMAGQDLSSEEQRAIAELKKQVASLAIARVEAQLSGILDDSAQGKLIDRSIAQLGGS